MDFNGFSYEWSKYHKDTNGLMNLFDDKLDTYNGESYILFKFYLLANYEKLLGLDMIQEGFKYFYIECLDKMKVSLSEFTPKGWSKKKTFLAIFSMFEYLKIPSSFYFDYNNYLKLDIKNNFNTISSINSIPKNTYSAKEIENFKDYNLNNYLLDYEKIYNLSDDFFDNIFIFMTNKDIIIELIDIYKDVYKKGLFDLKDNFYSYENTISYFLNDLSISSKNTGFEKLDSKIDLSFLNNGNLYYLNLIDLIEKDIINLKINLNYKYNDLDLKIKYIFNNYSNFIEFINNKAGDDGFKNNDKIIKIETLDDIDFDEGGYKYLEHNFFEYAKKYNWDKNLSYDLFGLFIKLNNYYDLNFDFNKLFLFVELFTIFNNKLDYILELTDELKSDLLEKNKINNEVLNRLYSTEYKEINIQKSAKGKITNLDGMLDFSGEEKIRNLKDKYSFSDLTQIVHRGKTTKIQVKEKLNFKKGFDKTD